MKKLAKETTEPQPEGGEESRKELYFPAAAAAATDLSRVKWLKITQMYYLSIYYHGLFLHLQNASQQRLFPGFYLLLYYCPLASLSEGPCD